MEGPEILIPIVIFTSGFAMAFGIYYLRTRENLAMIEKGMNPKSTLPAKARPVPYQNLKWGLLLIGAGLGLLAAFILSTALPHYEPSNPILYFAFLAIGGGLGLVGSFKAEKAWLDKAEKLSNE